MSQSIRTLCLRLRPFNPLKLVFRVSSLAQRSRKMAAPQMPVSSISVLHSSGCSRIFTYLVEIQVGSR
jgi:hypothetical protein